MFDQFAAFVYYFISFPLVFGILSLLYSDLGLLLRFFVLFWVFLDGGGGSSFDNLLYCIDLRSSVTVLENL